jgi:hypothetical protein
VRLRSIATLLPLLAACVVARVAGATPPGSDLLARYASLPLLFERVATREASVQFVARGANYTVAVGADAVRVLPATGARRVPIGMRFADASPRPQIRGDGRLAVIHHLGAGSDRHVPAYERVRIAGLYPGIDVAFHAHGAELEYDVVVAPGGDPARFALTVDADERVVLNDEGALVLATGDGALVLKRPVAYQDVDGTRRAVDSRFILDAERIRIAVGEYDRAYALVIDPVVSYATYVGGNSTEQGTAIAVDAAGNAYVTGYTQSSDFPLVNAYDRSIGRKGDVDVFVSKLNPAGTGLVWSTFLGGSTGADRAIAIAVDASGSAYVTGQTSGADFPTSASAWQKGTTGGGGFVAKLAPAGNALAYSTYVAGATPSGIGVDAAGNAYVAGSATSAFVTTASALQTAINSSSGTTAFLLKLNATGSAAVFATFLGGSTGEDATSLAVDARGSVYVGGWTTSADFPVRNAFQPAKGSAKDGFVAKVAGDGSQLLYATLLGGNLDDAVNAIAVDASGNAYVAGETYSTDFPVISGFQMRKGGQLLVNSSQGNAFVAKLSPTGNALVYASYLAGEICQSLCQSVFGVPQIRSDAAYGIAVDAAGHAYVTGLANSWTFPLVDSAAQRKQQDNENSAFVTKVSISGAALLWSTFLRTGYDMGASSTRFPAGSTTGVAIDASNAAFVTGTSNDSSGFLATAGALRTSSVEPSAIVAKFASAATMTITTSNATTDTQTPVTVTATLQGATTSGNVNFYSDGGWIGSAALAGNRASLTSTLPAGVHALTAIASLPASSPDAAPITQVVDVPLVCNP